MTCEEVRLSLGAHALGALEPDEATEIDTHLATCEVCGAELLDLEGVTEFLGKVSERDVELVASPPHEVLDRLLNARAKRSRRGRLLLAVAASVALLAVSGTVWTLSREPQAQQSASAPASRAEPRTEAAQPKVLGDAPSADARLKSEPAPTSSRTALGREFGGENKAKEYYASVAAFPGSSGTELSVRVRGIPFGTHCRLVVLSTAGERDDTEAWTINRDAYARRVLYPRHTWIPMNGIARFEVVDGADNVLVKVAGPNGK
jgi:hypothetical protein